MTKLALVPTLPPTMLWMLSYDRAIVSISDSARFFLPAFHTLCRLYNHTLFITHLT